MTEDPTTQEFRTRQAKREEEEREKAEESPSPDETDQHEARADKAAYLKKKLEERAAAEREAKASEDSDDA
jgi:hypothetical protein